MDGTGRFLVLGTGTVRCGSFLTATPEQKLYDKTSLVSDTSVRNRASGDT
jgi:hypothetical protein